MYNVYLHNFHKSDNLISDTTKKDLIYSIIMRYLSVFFIIIILFILSCTSPGNIRTRHLLFYDDRRDEIIETAKKYIGVKYEEKGSSPDGFDCSGFTLYIYKKNGFIIPRKASSQYKSGKRINLKSAKPGDLVFFNVKGNYISHVGIYAGNYEFIHSPSLGKSVSYASINNPYWKKRYIGAITYFAN